MGFFAKIKQGLKRTRDNIGSMFGTLFAPGRAADKALLSDLEDALIIADLGVACTTRVMDELNETIKSEKLENAEEVKEALKSILKAKTQQSAPKEEVLTKPSVILVIGVNGVGKTTTIGKLAAIYKENGKKVLLAAADTFRAAAADQLEIWAERSGADIVRRTEGADPASVIFDALRAGVARGVDMIICDTAGRLHNKANLMNELAKINKIIDRELPDAHKEVLLVIDATTGQNALVQAKEFKNVAGVTSIALTKLDGTAKGGIAIAVADELGLPIKYVGVGEQINDLIPFDPNAFVDAMFD